MASKSVTHAGKKKKEQLSLKFLLVLHMRTSHFN